MAHKPVVGLIGGIGAGKSMVASEFGQHGARVISGDQLGHEALKQPAIREQVIARFGEGVRDAGGQINRRKLGGIVFGDAAKRQEFERIVHPWIEDRLRNEIAAAQRDPACRLIVLDAAIMLEAGWHDVCDKLVFIDAPREERLRRVAGQRGWGPEEVAAREQAQMALSEKQQLAHEVLDNSGPPEHLHAQVRALLERWERQGDRPLVQTAS